MAPHPAPFVVLGLRGVSCSPPVQLVSASESITEAAGHSIQLVVLQLSVR
jgi:hypothetical protein